MDEYLEELMNVIEKARKSKAASAPVITTPCNYVVSHNPNRIINDGPKVWKEERQSNGSVVYTNPSSKAASVLGINKLQEIIKFHMSNGRL